MRTAFSLSGGGSRGDFEVGAIRYLYDQGIHPDILASTSVGSINALKLAEGEGSATQGLQGLEMLWLGLNKNEDMFMKEAWMNDPVAKPFADMIVAMLAQAPSAFSELASYDALTQMEMALSTYPLDPVIGETFGVTLDDLVPIWAELAWAGAAMLHIPLLALVITAVTENTIKDLLALLSKVEALYNLSPIEALAKSGPAKLSTANIISWASEGRQWRIGMVGLASGELRYVTENGTMVERDGVTAAGDKGGFIRNIPFLQAAMASASIPSFFPPVTVRGDAYVDGGVREVIPVEVALNLGADQIYAVQASKFGADPKPDMSPDFKPKPNLNILSIGLHSLMDLAIDEVTRGDTPMAGDPRLAKVTIIQPRLDIHDIMTVYPGFIRSRMAYGYLCAADAVAPPANVQRANEIADEIAILRYGSARLECWFYGWPIPPTLEVAPRDKSQAGTDLILGGIRTLKTRIRTLLTERATLGAAIPPIDGTWRDPLKWWGDWEAHPLGPTMGSPWGSTSTLGIGDHFYTVSADERDTAILQKGYTSEGIAGYVLPAQIVGSVPLNRVFNPADGHHHLTTSAGELDVMVNQFGMIDEGAICAVYSDGVDGSPFYRLRNVSNGDHFYTSDLIERDRAIANFGYQSEGVACVLPSPAMHAASVNAATLFRLFNHSKNDHFYTRFTAERDSAVSADGYQDDHVESLVFDAGSVPLYRLRQTKSGQHFYTIDDAERANAVAAFGFVDEPIAAYVLSDMNGRTRLYGCSNAAGDAIYTTSLLERDKEITSGGYTSAGVACTVVESPKQGLVPLYRLRKAA